MQKARKAYRDALDAAINACMDLRELPLWVPVHDDERAAFAALVLERTDRTTAIFASLISRMSALCDHTTIPIDGARLAAELHAVIKETISDHFDVTMRGSPDG